MKLIEFITGVKEDISKNGFLNEMILKYVYLFFFI